LTHKDGSESIQNNSRGYGTDISYRKNNRDRINSNPSKILEKMAKSKQEVTQDMTTNTSNKGLNPMQIGASNFFTERTDSYPETYSGGVSNIKEKPNTSSQNRVAMGPVTAFDQGEPNFTGKSKLTVKIDSETKNKGRKSEKLIKRNTVDCSNCSPVRLTTGAKQSRTGKKINGSLKKRLMEKKKATLDLASKDQIESRNVANGQRQTERSETISAHNNRRKYS
jgi:hypothetical protein